MGLSYFGIPGKRSHVDVREIWWLVHWVLMGQGCVFGSMCMGQGCVFGSMCMSSCVSSNGKISRWLVYITLSVEILCGPFFSLLAPGMGRRLEFRPGVSEVRRVHGTVQIAIPTFILWLCECLCTGLLPFYAILMSMYLELIQSLDVVKMSHL